MKKMIFTILSLVLSTGMVLAQDMTVGTASISKVDRTCVVANYTMPSDIVGDALSDKLKKSKISKGSKVKGGFRVYKGVGIPEISDDKVDVYTKISGKKDNSTLYFAVSRGYDNFVTPENDPAMMKKIQAYVKSMMANVNIAKIKTDIAAQAKVVNKAEKVEKSTIKTGEGLVSDMKSLESKIASNKKDQEANKKEQAEATKNLQKEQALLEELKTKLENMVK